MSQCSVRICFASVDVVFHSFPLSRPRGPKDRYSGWTTISTPGSPILPLSHQAKSLFSNLSPSRILGNPGIDIRDGTKISTPGSPILPLSHKPSHFSPTFPLLAFFFGATWSQFTDNLITHHAWYVFHYQSIHCSTCYGKCRQDETNSDGYTCPENR